MVVATAVVKELQSFLYFLILNSVCARACGCVKRYTFTFPLLLRGNKNEVQHKYIIVLCTTILWNGLLHYDLISEYAVRA